MACKNIYQSLNSVTEMEEVRKMEDMTVGELKNKKLWFLWSAKPAKNGKVTKIPFSANGGATGTDDAHKDTWVSFDEANTAKNKFQASGIGMKIPKGCFLLEFLIIRPKFEEFILNSSEI